MLKPAAVVRRWSYAVPGGSVPSNCASLAGVTSLGSPLNSPLDVVVLYQSPQPYCNCVLIASKAVNISLSGGNPKLLIASPCCLAMKPAVPHFIYRSNRCMTFLCV